MAPNTVIASNNVFFPKEMNVAVGTTVTWRNIGTYPHNVVSKDRLFNSHPNCNAGPVETNHTGCMKVGEVFRYAFSKAGTFQYYCYIHAVCDTRGCSGSMVGTITVA